MTFSTAKPADTQKIRLGPQDIRDNFTAIVNGDSSFTPATINLDKQGSAPTALSDVGIVFASEIGSGSYTELYFKNENDSLVQLTQDDTLGSETTDIYAQSIRLDTDSSAVTFGVNNMIVASATVASDGTLTNGLNVASSSKTATGRYTVNVTADVLLNANYRVIATCNTDGRQINVETKPTPVGATVTAVTLATRLSSTGNYGDSGFDIIVIGGR